MAKISERQNSTILIKLAIILPCFYALYYVLVGIMVGGFSLFNENGAMPFDWVSINPAFVGRPLATWLAMAITYFVFPFIVFGVTRAFSYAWDYSVTVSIIHFCVTCIVSRSFIFSWIWWVTFVVGTVFVVAVSEFLCYRWEMRTIELE